jgi:hypothetical protein
MRDQHKNNNEAKQPLGNSSSLIYSSLDGNQPENTAETRQREQNNEWQKPHEVKRKNTSIELFDLQSNPNHFETEQVTITINSQNNVLGQKNNAVEASSLLRLQPLHYAVVPIEEESENKNSKPHHSTQSIIRGLERNVQTQIPTATPLLSHNIKTVRALTREMADPLEDITEGELDAIFPGDFDQEGRPVRSDRQIGRYIRNPNSGEIFGVMEINNRIITVRVGDPGEWDLIYTEIRIKSQNLDQTIKNLKSIVEKMEDWEESKERARFLLFCFSMLGLIAGGALAGGSCIGGCNDPKLLGFGIAISIVSLIEFLIICKSYGSQSLPSWHAPIESTNILEGRDIDCLNRYFTENSGRLEEPNPRISERPAFDLLRLLEGFLLALKIVRNSKNTNILYARGMIPTTQPAGLNPIILTTGAVLQIKGLTEQKTETKDKEKKAGPILIMSLEKMTLELSPQSIPVIIKRFKRILKKLEYSERAMIKERNSYLWLIPLPALTEALMSLIQFSLAMKAGRPNSALLYSQVIVFLFLVVIGYCCWEKHKTATNAIKTAFLESEILSEDDKTVLKTCVQVDEIATVSDLTSAIKKVFLPVLRDIRNGIYPEYSNALGMSSSLPEGKNELKSPRRLSIFEETAQQSAVLSTAAINQTAAADEGQDTTPPTFY